MSGRLTISLSALAGNYHRLTQTATGSVAGVVKADAYGLGAAAVVGRLTAEGCREFFVATANEGVALRRELAAASPPALVKAPVYVLEGAYRESLPALVEHDLTPILNTSEQFSVWASAGRPAGVHVDTGMERLGLPLDTAAQILASPLVPVELFISHFARADEPGHVSVGEQLQRAQQVYQAARTTHPHLRLSLCNSAALLQGLGPEDVGRAGIGLYGGNPYDSACVDWPNPMAPVVTMEARVMQIRNVPAGTPIGYGGRFTTERDSTLAVLGVGYADGLPRLLSNNGYVYLGGVRQPVVGRISMDLTIVDVTQDSAGVRVAEGDWAEIFGTHISVDEVAQQAQTLSYEILTGISRRLPRAYVA